VDTDWAIHYLRGNPRITERLLAAKALGLGISLITLAELYEGIYYSRDPKEHMDRLMYFLRGFRVIGLDIETCKAFAWERGRLRSAGQAIGDFDLLIGVSARQNGLILLTNNRRHFERIKDLRIESVSLD
jgi:tRNA(fMet)-specific endonuclease VapC